MRRNKFSEAARLLAADIKNCRWALLIIAACLFIEKVLLHTACPFVRLTGFPCPACGLTRAGFALLQGEFALAWQLNSFIYIVVLGGVFFFVWRYILRKELKGLKKYAQAALVLLFGYYIYRMIVYFPGDAPMSYQYDNIIRNLLNIL